MADTTFFGRESVVNVDGSLEATAQAQDERARALLDELKNRGLALAGIQIYCGTEEQIGWQDIPEWRVWVDEKTSPDQLRIEDCLAHAPILGSSILHVGVGNSSLAQRFYRQAGEIFGTTIYEPEREFAAHLNLGNYSVSLINKYARKMFRINRHFDFIVDNNPSSFACCAFHFCRMMIAYRDLLSERGELVTAQPGLGWVITGRDLNWSLGWNDWVLVAAALGLHANKVDEFVYTMRRGGAGSALTHTSTGDGGGPSCVTPREIAVWTATEPSPAGEAPGGMPTPPSQTSGQEPVTVVVTSCGRQDLLERTLDSFFAFNTAPLAKFIVIEDGPADANAGLIAKYRRHGIVWLATETRVGQIAAIDCAYAQVDSPYIFHLEDDWQFHCGGFIEKSMTILRADPDCFQVWLRALDDTAGHPLSERLYAIGEVPFRKLQTDFEGMWHGFSFNPGLRRLADYSLLGNYRQFAPCEEYLSEIYNKLGFFAAILTDNGGRGYVKHIGGGRTVAEPATAWQRQLTGNAVAFRVPILMYHDVADEGPPETAPYRISSVAFRRQMLFLRDRGYQSISLEEWADCIKQRRAPTGRRVVITFDDGFRSVARNALPVLAEAGFQATMFVVTGRVGGVADWDQLSGEPPALMDWDELRALQQRGHAIASHCALHRDLTQLSDEVIAADARSARAALQRELGCEGAAVAYPWGENDERVRRVLSASGYRIGLGVTGGLSTLRGDLMSLPRIEVFADDDIDIFARKIDAEELAMHTGDGWIKFAADRPPAAPLAATPEQAARLDELGLLAARLDYLLEELTTIKAAVDQLYAAAVAVPPGVASLHRKLLRLFTEPVAAPVSQALVPYQEVSPGIRIGFGPDAWARLTIAPKHDQNASPPEYLNTLRLSFGGSWLSIEVSLADEEVDRTRHFQFGLRGGPSRRIGGRLVLTQRPREGFEDIVLGHLRMAPVQQGYNISGEFALPAAVETAATSTKQFIIIWETGPDPLEIELSYLDLYFA